MKSRKLVKKGRKILSAPEKLQIIELGQQGLTHQKIANRFDVGRSTVTKILNSNNNKNAYLKIEKLLLRWYLSRKLEEDVSYNQLLDKLKQLCLNLNFDLDLNSYLNKFILENHLNVNKHVNLNSNLTFINYPLEMNNSSINYEFNLLPIESTTTYTPSVPSNYIPSINNNINIPNIEFNNNFNPNIPYSNNTYNMLYCNDPIRPFISVPSSIRYNYQNYYNTPFFP